MSKKLYFKILKSQRSLHTVSPKKPWNVQLILVSLNDFSLFKSKKKELVRLYYIVLYTIEIPGNYKGYVWIDG